MGFVAGHRTLLAPGPVFGLCRELAGSPARTKLCFLGTAGGDQRHRQAAVLEAFQASVSNDVSQYATRISTSTLLIVADKDDITPVASQQRLQTLFPDADLVMIADVGHLIHYEAPDQAADAIRTFLDEGPS